MRRLITYFRVLLIVQLVLLNSCVNDDSFIPDNSGDDITASTAVVSILNDFRAVDTSSLENELCFRFVYPIILGYNNDSTIRIDNFRGLIDVISSQSINFNITGLEFPIQIIYRNSDGPITIENETALISVLRECGFDTLRDELDKFSDRCFTFDYPITLLSQTNEEVTVDSAEEFDVFWQNQGVDYQPRFKFPVNVLVAPNSTEVEINTYFGFYRIINNCEFCPQLGFTSEVTNNLELEYKFVASFPDLQLVDKYKWYINNEFIEEDGVGVQGDNMLVHSFNASGTYQVCMKADIADCPEMVVFCREIVIDSFCPDLFFEFEQEPETLGYNFTASFNQITDVTYQWFLDNDMVESDGGANGDNMLFLELTPGTHNICIRTEATSCPQGTEFCREVMVEPICPDLAFTIEQQGNTSSYDFIAAFSGIDTTPFEWLVDGMVVDNGGGAGGNNTLTRQFSPGTYTICIRAESNTCPDGTEFCEQLVVN
ncbi:hypothetical protein [Aquimarina sp. 2201CG5-10]|uniref:hypothetical protein n=1 Tax=Aquimarina callyspongiae TaxID=3098150 RepID=UPI002AB49CD1|nr:hypothetical protein [Aquimarina sp. 2201CG5-10]MDY8137663.1 hypothetical protein [Aquimarina sp. 2201CG5-10]